MTMIEKYRPSNGTEGECFMAQWCARCERDRARREDFEADGCPIVVNTMAYGIDDPEYPQEWRRDGPQGPRCVAFAAVDSGDQPIDPAAVIRPLL